MTMPTVTVNASGISAPSFADYLAGLTAEYQSIFGADSYLGNDSQDGQLLSVFAQALADSAAASVAIYNSFSPATAQGNGLSSIVKINGLARLVPSSSTVQVTLTGVANTTITNGLVTDTSGIVWALPSSVTIPAAGTITVTATCTSQGAIAAGTSTVTTIKTPVSGWQSVTNASAASLGAPVESDAALRVRQSVSTALPSVTIFSGIVAAIENLAGVTRCRGYENNTGSTDGNSVPAHSLAFIVEGGTAGLIENAIAEKIPPGIGTYGTTSATIVDPTGSTRAIAYSVATPATIGISLTLKALNGWAVTTEPLIQAALTAYIEALPIGVNVNYLQIAIPTALSGMPQAGTFAITGIQLKKNAGSLAAADVTIAYNEVPVTAPVSILFTIT